MEPSGAEENSLGEEDGLLPAIAEARRKREIIRAATAFRNEIILELRAGVH